MSNRFRGFLSLWQGPGPGLGPGLRDTLLSPTGPETLRLPHPFDLPRLPCPLFFCIHFLSHFRCMSPQNNFWTHRLVSQKWSAAFHIFSLHFSTGRCGGRAGACAGTRAGLELELGLGLGLGLGLESNFFGPANVYISALVTRRSTGSCWLTRGILHSVRAQDVRLLLAVMAQHWNRRRRGRGGGGLGQGSHNADTWSYDAFGPVLQSLCQMSERAPSKVRSLGKKACDT